MDKDYVLSKSTSGANIMHAIQKNCHLCVMFKALQGLLITETLTFMAENIGGTCQISPRKEAVAFFMSSSLICSQGSR